MILTVDLTDLDLNEYFSIEDEGELKLTKVFMNEIIHSLVYKLKDTTECKRIVNNELHEPIRRFAKEYLESGAVVEATKECIKEKTRWDSLTYYEVFKSEIEKVVDEHISHFESKLEEAIKNRIRLRIDEITEEYVSKIYKNSAFADFIDKDKVSQRITELLNCSKDKPQ